MIVADEFIDSVAIMNARDGLWRAAYEAYVEMAAKTPHGHDYPLYLTGEAADTAKELQERARKAEVWEDWIETMRDWMDEEHSLQSFLAQNGGDLEDALDESYMGVRLDSVVCRVAFTKEDAIREALGMHGNVPSTAQAHQMWEKIIEVLKAEGWTHAKARVGGLQRRFMVRPDISPDEKSRGFRICDPAQAPGIAYTQVDDDDDADSLI
mgnify:CR=1 FL=1